MTTFVTPVAEESHYGVPVTHVGEDGDMLALITSGWGQFRKPRAGDAEDPDCEWYLDPCAPDASNARPYMRIRIA